MLASAQNHPCAERGEESREKVEEEEKEEEEKEEEGTEGERATDVSGDVQGSQRTSSSLHAAAPHTNLGGSPPEISRLQIGKKNVVSFCADRILKYYHLTTSDSTGCFPADFLLKMF